MVFCAVFLFAGSYIDSTGSNSAQIEGAGVWRCGVETTSTKGALLSPPGSGVVWASGRRLAESVSRGDSVLIIGSISGAFMNGSAFRAIPSNSIPDRVRRKATSVLSERISSRTASSLTAALLVGERGYLSPSVRQVFADTGTSHLLALSGLHVGILSTFALIFFRKLFGRGWLSLLFVVLALFIYVSVSGARASTLRAGLMLLFVLVLFHLSGRTPDLLFVWSVAVIVLTVLSSGHVLENMGAQMSFGAVLSLIILGRKFTGKTAWLFSAGYAGIVVTVSLSPLVSFTYGGVNPVAPVATVLSVPFMLGTMLTGFLALAFPFLLSLSILNEWFVFIWLAILEILKSGRMVFSTRMFWLWSVCIIILWLFSRRSGFLRRFR